MNQSEILFSKIDSDRSDIEFFCQELRIIEKNFKSLYLNSIVFRYNFKPTVEKIIKLKNFFSVLETQIFLMNYFSSLNTVRIVIDLDGNSFRLKLLLAEKYTQEMIEELIKIRKFKSPITLIYSDFDKALFVKVDQKTMIGNKTRPKGLLYE